MNENDGGIGKQGKRKEPGFGGKKGNCDVGIPAKEGEYTTVLISCSGFCVFLSYFHSFLLRKSYWLPLQNPIFRAQYLLL